ncbi:MAG: thioesterase family protein [Phototrophicaceae bacterium]
MLEEFRYQQAIEVRFADLDALGHLNNATYLTYCEQIRIRYIQDVCGRSENWNQLGMILARTEIDYLQPITFEDTVTLHIRVSRLGGKSFDMLYAITRQAEDDDRVHIAAQAKTVMVSFDYHTQSTIAVPEFWRTAITSYEPQL